LILVPALILDLVVVLALGFWFLERRVVAEIGWSRLATGGDSQ
jgi:uncharacterized membrane protein